MKIDFWQIVYIVGIIQSLFLSLVFFKLKKGNLTANKYLSLLLLLISIILFDSVYNSTQLIVLFPHASLLTYQSWFFLSPAIYFYVKALISNPVKYNFRVLIHLIPFLISTLIMINYYLMDSDSLLAVFGDGDEMFRIVMIFVTMYSIQSIIYLSIIFKIINRYTKAYLDQSANTQIYFLQWIKWIFYGLLFFLVLDTLSFYLLFFMNVNTVLTSKISLVALTIFSFLTTYFAIVNPDLVLPKIVETKEKYKRSKLDNSKLQDYISKIGNYMAEQKPYLDCDFNLKSLSENLNIPAHQMSQILNQVMGQSFYDFVNKYRIEEVKLRFLSPKYKNQTILAVALDVGFNSNASFYRIFKKHTGITPSEFINNNR